MSSSPSPPPAFGTPSVVVTGTSTGIGRAAALFLDREGFRVFAGVRRAEDAESLRREASARVTPLMLDVTDAAAIALAAKSVGEELGQAGLGGLVNNAGIGVGGPLEFADLDEVRRQFEVNVFGPLAVTQAFLPLLRAAKGRVVHVSSGAGVVSTPLLGPYSASKAALELMADAMRVELRGAGIRVCVVEPGFIETPMLDKGQARVTEEIAKLPPRGREIYETPLRKFGESMARLGRRASKPEAVAKAIHDALTAPRPRTRYRVGLDAKLLTGAVRALPDRVRDSLFGRLVGL